MTEQEKLEFHSQLCKRMNTSPWQQKVLWDVIDEIEVKVGSNWQAGTPTEEGWYLVWMGAINGNINERPAVMLFENGDWASRLVANTYVAWQKITPYEGEEVNG